MAPAIRPAFLVGCMSFNFQFPTSFIDLTESCATRSIHCMRNQVHLKSQWAAITAESDRCGYECRGNYESDPEPRRSQVSSRGELKQRINCNTVFWVERESCVAGTEHAIFQH